MKEFNGSIFWVLLLTLILLPILSAQASVVPKHLYAPAEKMTMPKAIPAAMPAPEEPYTGEGTVVAFKAEPWDGSAICVAQIQQADGKAFNAYVPALVKESVRMQKKSFWKKIFSPFKGEGGDQLVHQPMVRLKQGDIICEILLDASRSGKKVRIDGMIFEHGSQGKLGKLRVQHIRYFRNPVGEESPDISNEGIGDDFGCMGYCTLIGSIVSVDANIDRWTEWDPEYQEQATACRAIMLVPYEKFVKIWIGGGAGTDMDWLKTDDAGRLAELGQKDPTKIEQFMGDEYAGVDCDLLLGGAYGVQGFFAKMIEDIDESYHNELGGESYVPGLKTRSRQELICAALADALSEGRKAVLHGHSTAIGMISFMYLIEYPDDFELPKTDDDQPIYVIEGKLDDFSADNDWAVGSNAFWGL